MPTFALVYHVAGSDEKPQESIEAESLANAGEIVAKQFETGGAIAIPSGDDLVVIPKSSVAACHIRQIQERLKRTTRMRSPFEDPEEDEIAAPNFITPGQ